MNTAANDPANVPFGILSDRGTGTWQSLETEFGFLHHTIADCMVFSQDNMHIVQGVHKPAL